MHVTLLGRGSPPHTRPPAIRQLCSRYEYGMNGDCRNFVIPRVSELLQVCFQVMTEPFKLLHLYLQVMTEFYEYGMDGA